MGAQRMLLIVGVAISTLTVACEGQDRQQRIEQYDEMYTDAGSAAAFVYMVAMPMDDKDTYWCSNFNSEMKKLRDARSRLSYSEYVKWEDATIQRKGAEGYALGIRLMKLASEFCESFRE